MSKNYLMTKHVISRQMLLTMVLAGFWSGPGVAAEADASTNGECGIDRLCMTPSVQSVVDDELRHQRRAKKLRHTLDLETLRADIAEQKKAQIIKPEPVAEPAPDPAPPAAPPERVSTNFPTPGGPTGGDPRFPFPRNLIGENGESRPKPPSFSVSGVGNGRAVVQVNGASRLVSVGDAVPVGKIKKITFDGVVVSHNGETKQYSVNW